jgi:bla regulator protein BlaR1
VATVAARNDPMLTAAALVMVSIPFAIGIVRAQSLPPEPVYTYEVVSIHLSQPGQGKTYFRGYRTQNATALELLTWAYGVHEYQVSGAPAWATSTRFDVTFTPDKKEPSPGPGMGMAQVDAWMGRNRQRMQAILRDRFGLVLRAESHELPIYTLVVAKGGHKLLPPSDQPGPYFAVGGGAGGPRITARNATIKMLTDFLSRQLDRTVNDETGLSGQYDFKLEWTPDSPLQGRPNEPAIAATDGPSIFTALSEQLGLRLATRKGQVPVYVIEKIEKPGEN